MQFMLLTRNQGAYCCRHQQREDVYNVIKQGAIATGSSSAIFEQRSAAMIEMISAVRAWDERHK